MSSQIKKFKKDWKITYWSGNMMFEEVVRAYTHAQARFLFHKFHGNYPIQQIEEVDYGSRLVR